MTTKGRRIAGVNNKVLTEWQGLGHRALCTVVWQECTARAMRAVSGEGVCKCDGDRHQSQITGELQERGRMQGGSGRANARGRACTCVCACVCTVMAIGVGAKSQGSASASAHVRGDLQVRVCMCMCMCMHMRMSVCVRVSVCVCMSVWEWECGNGGRHWV